MLKFIRLVAILATVLTFSMPAAADDVAASGSGWINASGVDNSGGSFASSINNHFAGFEGQAYNNWFSFLLPDYAITSATLRIWNDERNSTIDPDALYTLHQAQSTDFSFAGLSAGSALGSITLGLADTGISEYIDITLNGTGLAALNSKLGSSFIFGGTITSAVDPSCNDCVTAFGYNGGVPVALLSLNVAAPVPEPEIYAMMVAGLSLMGFLARRRKKQTA